MRRNVGGQFIGAQLIAKADGTPITSGTTTVYVTGDAGTQAAGSVSAGAATHEGNGYWTYAPAQAETNYTQVAFTFVNTNAINATIQVYPLAYDASGQFTGVTVGTNNDKTGYSLSQAFPTNFASLSVDGSGRVDVIKIAGTTQTARDIGASVLLSAGTGTGQLDITSGVVKANATQFAGQTITAAAGVTIPASIASPTNITAGTITTVTNLTNAPSSGDLTAAMKASVNAEVVDALATDTYAEPSAPPAATASIAAKISWNCALARNKITQTATTQTLRNDADSGNISTAAVSDDGTTFTRAEWA